MTAQIFRTAPPHDNDFAIGGVLLMLVLLGLAGWFIYLISSNVALHEEDDEPEREEKAAPSRERVTAAIFALIFGWLGVQHFYLGKTAAGVVSLLTCWTGIPAIVGLIDFAIFIGMKDEKFDRIYNKPRKRRGIPA